MHAGTESCYTREHFPQPSSNIHVALVGDKRLRGNSADVAVRVQKVQIPETSLYQPGGRSERESGDRDVATGVFITY